MDQSSPSAIKHLLQLDHLTYLELMGLLPTTMTSLVRSASSTTTTIWPHLQALVFLNCNDVEDTLWLDFIQTHTRLQGICMSDSKITDTNMIPMAMALPHLLQVQWISNPHLTPFGIRQFVRQVATTLILVQCDMCIMIRATDFEEWADLATCQISEDVLDLDKIAIGNIRSTDT